MRKKVTPPYFHKDGSNCWTKNCSRDKPKTVKVPKPSGLSKYGTEQVGLSVEIAVADIFNVNINPKYRSRGNQDVVSHVTTSIATVFATNNIPRPVKHIAEGQSKTDFLLAGGKTLSCKSNMRGLGMVAPQEIGQPSSKTFWQKMPHLVPAGVNVMATNFTYEDSKKLFKQVVRTRTVELLTAYWEKLFDCDYTLILSDILRDNNEVSEHQPTVKVVKKTKPPKWDKDEISFTKSLNDWTESCSVKYKGITIGSWQVHNNRDCFKFRFNLKGLEQAGLL